MLNRILSWDNNPVFVEDNVLLYRSGYKPMPGDNILFLGCTTTVSQVEGLEPGGEQNWRVVLVGKEVAKLKERMAYGTRPLQKPDAEAEA